MVRCSLTSLPALYSCSPDAKRKVTATFRMSTASAEAALRSNQEPSMSVNPDNAIAETTPPAASPDVEEDVTAADPDKKTSTIPETSQSPISGEQLLHEASQKLEEKKVMNEIGRFKTVLDVLSKVGHMTKDVSVHSVRGTIVLTNCVVRFIGPLALRPMPWIH